MVESELGEIPKGWEITELSSIANISSGKRPITKFGDKIDGNYYPIIGASKIMGYTNNFLFDEPIIITGRVGTHGVIQKYRDKIWPSDNTFVIKSDYLGITYQLLNLIDYKSLNRGSTQPLITQTDLKKQKIILPKNKLLLEKLNDSISVNENAYFNLKEENIFLEQLRDTLLPKLLSGEIEIPEDLEV